MKKPTRIVPLGLLSLSLAMPLAGIVGCSNQDPGQPPVRSISAPGRKASVAPAAAAGKVKKAPARH